MILKKVKRILCLTAAIAVVCTSTPIYAADISESVTVTEQEQENSDKKTNSEEADSPYILYQGYVQNKGWVAEQADGAIGGTVGSGLRMEGIKIFLDSEIQGNIIYRTHVQNIGWQDWKQNGEYAGTQQKSYRMEAIEIKLSGEIAAAYDVYYRVHVQNIGWLGWAKNGESAGTEKASLRIEAIQAVLVNKDEDPSLDDNGRRALYSLDISYQTHVQNIGWEQVHYNGETAGTVGRALRLEGITMNVDSCFGNEIIYRTHVQNIGWQDWRQDSNIAGTEGQSLRLEAIQIQLTQEMAAIYDIYYRVHA